MYKLSLWITTKNLSILYKLDEDEEKLDAEVDEMFEKLGVAATSEPIINEENNS